MMLFLFVSLLLTATTGLVSDTISATTGLMKFAEILASTDFSEIKSQVDTGARTVFAPTDAAFGASFVVPTATDEVAALKNVLKYHVLGSTVLAADVTAVTFPATLQGDKVRVSNGTMVMVNLATVTTPNVLADNAGDPAVIHIIDQVLMIPVKVSELAVVTESLQILSAVLENVNYADIKSTLNSEGARTVFAPTDDAFRAAQITSVPTAPAAVTATKALLKYHVLGSKVLATNSLPALGFVATVQGQNVRVTRTGGFIFEGPLTVKVNQATVTTPNVLANGGEAAVIHIIDQVLMIPVTVSEIAFHTESLQILSDVLENDNYADIKSTLNSAGARTVFAPTDDAFRAAQITSVPTSTAAVATTKTLLTYHVLGSKVLAADVSALSFPRTLAVYRVRVARVNSTVTVGSARVTTPNVLANANQAAVIHVIDQVLQIPGLASDVLRGKSDLSNITAALTRAGLVSTVDGFADSTLFVPANGARTSTALTALTGTKLNNTILQHVLVNQTVFSTDLTIGRDLTSACPSATESGCQVLKITNNDQKWYVNGVEITTTDMLTRNGVIHIISEPLALKPPAISAASALTVSVALMAVVASILM